MPPKELDTLKKGFNILAKRIDTRKNELTTKLRQKQSISPEDERWLDNEGNTIEEQRVLDILGAAPDYKNGLEQLDDGGKAIVKKLRELAGDLPKVAGNKRQRSEFEKATRAPAKKPAPVPMTAAESARRENATLAQRIEALDWFHKNGKNQTKTAEHFARIWPNLKMKQPLVSSWLKDESKWRAQWAEANTKNQRSAKRARQTEHPDVTEMMDLWVSKAMGDKIVLTGEVLRQKWTQFANLAGIPDDEKLKLSNGWLDHFKQRHGLKALKRHGEAASAKASTVEAERKRVQYLLRDSGYELRNIFNMDETGLFYGMAPDRGLADRKLSGIKMKKNRLTYAFTSNADGSEKLKPFVIGKPARPRAFKKKTGEQLGFYYRNNAKAWMTAELYQGWLLNWDLELRKVNRKILLLQDNFSGHIVPDGLEYIRVENFEPNLTAHVQPKDQGIIRCFKAHYRAQFIQRAINRYDEGITPSEIYDINQLQAMRIADAAWSEVDTTTIRNCWQKAGILPETTTPNIAQPSIPIISLLNSTVDVSSQMDPVAHAEKEVEVALDGLVATGVLQKANRMDIESLLNPAGESHILSETSDNEIYQAVVAAQEARENIEINGGDDLDDDVSHIESRPTRREVVKATSTIHSYLDDLNDPVARKLETLLGSFTRQLRLEEVTTMKDTTLTDYFSY